MKITVFSAKGSAGKTPLSVNIALDREYAIGTNETYHVLDTLGVIPDDRILAISPNEAFPDVPDDIDIVFDLGGAIGGDSAKSITSAVEQSDLVIVPCYNEFKCITGAYHTILEVREINPNILIAATKLQKKKNENFQDWRGSDDFKNIRDRLHEATEHEYPVLPLKFSKGFDAIFDYEKSLRELVEAGGINAYAYREVAEQFEQIYSFIDGGKYHAA